MGHQQGRVWGWRGLGPALLLALSILGLYGLQLTRPDADALIVGFGLAPYDVDRGDLVGVFTYIFLHGGWLHAGANALFALLAGYWVARRLGGGGLGLISLFLFYLLCGVVAGLGYVLMHAGSQTLLIGASGAVSALIGAAARVAFRVGMRPIVSPTVFFVSGAWIAVNLLIASAMGDPTSGAMPVAWEAHLAGYFVGLALIGPWAALFAPRIYRVTEHDARPSTYGQMQTAADPHSPPPEPSAPVEEPPAPPDEAPPVQDPDPSPVPEQADGDRPAGDHDRVI